MRNLLLQNASKINQLMQQVRETFKSRDENDSAKKKWQQACVELHKHYNELAFPGGLDSAYVRILAGDTNAIEAAICFLECRPFFFRSGYIFKDILRKLKRMHLDETQRERFEIVLNKYNEYRQNQQRKRS